MIRTRRKRIPWSWTAFLAFPGGVEAFLESCTGTALTFTFWKFTQDSALLVFLGSINLAFNMVVAPLAAWQSDRLWTRQGRRLPFMLAGCALLIPALVALPLASTLWMLLALVLLCHAAIDVGFTGPWAPLYFEIVPSPQRGRAVVVKRLAMLGAQMLFNLALIGQFDAVYAMRLPWIARSRAVTITGEQIIYWLAALLVLAAVLLLRWRVRESRPPRVQTQPFSFTRFVRGVVAPRERWPLFLLAFSAVALGACLGQLQPLLITQQFGYSKQALGGMFAIALAAELVIALPLLAFLADRFSRLRLYQVLTGLAVLLPLVFWTFIKFVAPQQIPSPLQIILFMIAHSLIRTLALLTLEPLFFDAIHPDEFGAAYSSLLVIRGLGGMLVLNGVGWWVKLYSTFFPLGGPMRTDYASAYLYIALAAALALGATVLYAAKFRQSSSAAPAASRADSTPAATRLAASRPSGGACAICPHASGM